MDGDAEGHGEGWRDVEGYQLCGCGGELVGGGAEAGSGWVSWDLVRQGWCAYAGSGPLWRGCRFGWMSAVEVRRERERARARWGKCIFADGRLRW